MAEIKLYDYFDGWFGICGIGMGNNEATTVVSQIDKAVSDNEDLTIRINSGGGFVFDGWAIYNALIAAKSKIKVITINEGVAASIASVIFMAADTENRIMNKASLLMIHPPSIDPYYYGSMTAEDLIKEAECLTKIQDVLVSIYVEATGISTDAINSMVADTTWLTPDQSVSLGFAGSIVSSKEKADVIEGAMNFINSKAPANVKLYANRYFNTIKNENMETTQLLKDNTSFLKTIANKFDKVLAHLFKNASATLEDGSTIYYEGTLEDGTACFKDEAMTEVCSDGSYSIADKATFTIADGKVTEYKTIEDATNAADTLPADNAANDALVAEITALKAENETLQNAVNKSNSVLDALAKVQSSGKPDARNQSFSNGDGATKTLADIKAEKEERRNSYKK